MEKPHIWVKHHMGHHRTPHIFNLFFGQPSAKPDCLWASAGLFSATMPPSWASCPLLLRNGRKFQQDYSFILHFGEEAKLLLEGIASGPRGQNIFHISLFQAPTLSSHLLCDTLVGGNSHFYGFLGSQSARWETVAAARERLSVSQNW